VSSADALLLIVDDNEDNRYTLTRRLNREGYLNLATATNEALQVLESKPVDLVLLDIMMPEMNGYEVLEKMKGSDQLRHLPVIMISAVGEIDSVVRCIELGADDYLSKPFNPVLLRARGCEPGKEAAARPGGGAGRRSRHLEPNTRAAGGRSAG
jgi:CheY-like chemotaxis protein